MFSHDSDLPRFDAHPQRHNALGGFAWKAGLILAAAAVGEGAMLLEKSRQPKDPRIDDQPSDNPERLFIAHFGLNTDDEANAAAFKANFGHLGEVACIVHSKAGVPLDKIKQKTIDLCAKRPDAQITLYGHSWGGFANALMVSDPNFRSELGHVQNLVFENSFVDPAAISRLGQVLLTTAHLGPLSWAASRFVPSAKAPTYLTAEMHNVTRRSRAVPGAAEDFADNVFCIQPLHDPYVDNAAAYKSIQMFVGQQRVISIVDGDNRPPNCHEGATDYPTAFSDLFEREPAVLTTTAA